ncbi:MAG: SpoIIE family protein phosphatase [Spirochaetia bacterium]|nr:SpoIIE family protein phosphatase [Spirochaetia bacterium]
MPLIKEYEQFLNEAGREELADELRKYIGLLQINEIISSSFEIEKVLKDVLTQACNLTNAEIGSIFLINKKENVLEFKATTDPNYEMLEKIKVPLGQGISGYVAQTGEIVNTSNVQNDKRFYSDVDRVTGGKTESYLCVPLKVRNEIIGTAQLLNKKNNGIFTEDDIRISRAFSSQAAIAIERALLHNEALLSERIERELKVAAGIQKELLPQKDPEIEGYSISGTSIPARSVGGDYFNYFIQKENGKIKFVDIIIADVSGKGVPASLIVSNFHSGLQLLLPLYEKINDFTYHLNNFMKENLTMGNFITFFIMRLFPEEGKIQYANCGHNPPYYLKVNELKNEIIQLKSSGPIIGLLDNVDYKIHEMKIEKGDLLIPFSDGVDEAQNKKFDFFGEERTIEAITKSFEKAKKEDHLKNDISKFMVKEILKIVDNFRDGAELNDDTTLEVIYRLP